MQQGHNEGWGGQCRKRRSRFNLQLLNHVLGHSCVTTGMCAVSISAKEATSSNCMFLGPLAVCMHQMLQAVTAGALISYLHIRI